MRDTPSGRPDRFNFHKNNTKSSFGNLPMFVKTEEMSNFALLYQNVFDFKPLRDDRKLLEAL